MCEKLTKARIVFNYTILFLIVSHWDRDSLPVSESSFSTRRVVIQEISHYALIICTLNLE